MSLPIFLITLFCGSPAASAFTSPHQYSRNLSCNYSRHGHQSLSNSESLYSRRRIHRDSTDDDSAIATRLHLFGNLFGNEVEEDQKGLEENELARFSHLISTDDNPSTKFDSLSIMMSEWSKLFTDEDKKMGLTTPVALVQFPPQASVDNGEVTNYSGVQLLFQKGKTGGKSAYQDKDDEKNKNNEKKKEEPVKEGGVEVRVEQLTGGDLQVIASRCEIEEGTMVKEMSEQTIIDSLRKAMAAWKKEQES